MLGVVAVMLACLALYLMKGEKSWLTLFFSCSWHTCCHSCCRDQQLGWSFTHGVSIKRYCSGMGFIMTHDVTKYIADNAPNLPNLYKGYPEDAVVGLWLAGTNFKVQHDMRLHDWDWKRCSEESIIIHKHDYGKVGDDGVMRSCFAQNKQPQQAHCPSVPVILSIYCPKKCLSSSCRFHSAGCLQRV